MTIPATTWWQQALSIACVLLIVMGGASVLSAAGIGRRMRAATGRSRQRRFALGLAAAALGWLGLQRLPLRPRAEPEVITERRFSSSRLPAVSVDAPEGWQLTHDGGAGKVEGKSAHAGLVIETSLMSEPADVSFIVKGIADSQRERGYKVDPPFNDTIAGMGALAVTASNATRSTCVWVIKRGDRLVATIICATGAGTPPRDACRPVLSTLKWRAPGPL